jgi:Uncharacterised protein family, YAP/Alf4/glomulin
MVAFKRIRTNRPAKFLASFAAALLLAVTGAFQSLAETEDVTIVHTVVLEVLESMVAVWEGKREDEELVKLLEGVITQYLPVYLGNQMLYWSGQYWEQSHPVVSERIKSKDLVNEDLEAGMDKISVFSLGIDLSQVIAHKVGLSIEKLYSYIRNPPVDESDLDSQYPEGDSVIPINEEGCLLLLAHASTTHLSDIETILNKFPTKETLALHQNVVATSLDGANLALIDAIILLGLLLLPNLKPTDIPPFTAPTDPDPTAFLQYIQVSPTPTPS